MVTLHQTLETQVSLFNRSFPYETQAIAKRDRIISLVLPNVGPELLNIQCHAQGLFLIFAQLVGNVTTVGDEGRGVGSLSIVLFCFTSSHLNNFTRK